MWRSLLVGALGLAALETVLTLGGTAQGQLTKLLEIPGQWAEIFMDPNRPLVPDYHGGDTGGSTSSGGSGGTGGGGAPLTPSGQSTPASTIPPHPSTNPVTT